MEKDKIIIVDRDEFMSQMLKCIGSEEWEKAFADRTPAEVNAAMSGMAFGSLYAATHTPYHVVPKQRYIRPCDYCGSCSVWLAAFEPDTGLDTLEKVIAECVRQGCTIVGEEVKDAKV